ncbi:hypothetical protein [Pectobacterium carotovorum]|uniref:Uncharacterized protein n=1 Tax=Pectobacterium carotovorum subsp. carotovorum TaxID=555 RepID=A0AAI9L4M1_PECCC|nr:hypothetical protein [Pectobacterium carotovorum]GKX48653.1 hypothetical protein SOASR016_34050 [Pectobacterium carotovorum subsp. carotovorum]GLV71097.1 hypothetical protein Pcaca03_35410 [Pectobacterium carotovorum subsp. carotovorum]
MVNNAGLDPVIIERAAEQLRQERETFNQAKKHDQWWFVLRLVMGGTSVVLLISVLAISAYILFNTIDFPTTVVNSAGVALFVDVLGMLIGVWKIVLNPSFTSKLQPTTQSSIPNPQIE